MVTPSPRHATTYNYDEEEEEEPWDQHHGGYNNHPLSNPPYPGSVMRGTEEDLDDGELPSLRSPTDKNRMLSGQVTYRKPLNPPSSAGLTVDAEQRKFWNQFNQDDTAADEEDDNPNDNWEGSDGNDQRREAEMPMDEMMAARRAGYRSREINHVSQQTDEEVESADDYYSSAGHSNAVMTFDPEGNDRGGFCDDTLQALGTICGGAVRSLESATDGEPHPKRLAVALPAETQEENTAIEVEYVEPEIPEPSKRSLTPERKSDYLTKMVLQAKQDFWRRKETSNDDTGLERTSSEEDDIYNSFDATEKRKFLALINSGTPPVDASRKILENRKPAAKTSPRALFPEDQNVTTKSSDDNEAVETSTRRQGRGSILSFWRKSRQPKKKHEITDSYKSNKSHPSRLQSETPDEQPQIPMSKSKTSGGDELKEDSPTRSGGLDSKETSVSYANLDSYVDSSMESHGQIEHMKDESILAPNAAVSSTQQEINLGVVPQSTTGIKEVFGEPSARTQLNQSALLRTAQIGKQDMKIDARDKTNPVNLEQAQHSMLHVVPLTKDNDARQGVNMRSNAIQDTEDDYRFAKSGINYYDAARRDIGDEGSMDSSVQPPQPTSKTAKPVARSTGFVILKNRRATSVPQTREADTKAPWGAPSNDNPSADRRSIDLESDIAGTLVVSGPIGKFASESEVQSSGNDNVDKLVQQADAAQSRNLDDNSLQRRTVKSLISPAPVKEGTPNFGTEKQDSSVFLQTIGSINPKKDKIAAMDGDIGIEANKDDAAIKRRKKREVSVHVEGVDGGIDSYLETVKNVSEVSTKNDINYDTMSVYTMGTGVTGYTSGTTYTHSSRARRPGAAKTRLAKAKEAENTTRSIGWHESIRKVAESQNRVWDPKQGWVDYSEPVVEHEAQLEPAKMDKIHIDPIKLRSRREVPKIEEKDAHIADDVVTVPFPQSWEKERAEMISNAVKGPETLFDDSHEEKKFESSESRSIKAAGWKPQALSLQEEQSRSKGWLESMRIASEQMAKDGFHWSPEHGWRHVLSESKVVPDVVDFGGAVEKLSPVLTQEENDATELKTTDPSSNQAEQETDVVATLEQIEQVPITERDGYAEERLSALSLPPRDQKLNNWMAKAEQEPKNRSERSTEGSDRAVASTGPLAEPYVRLGDGIKNVTQVSDNPVETCQKTTIDSVQTTVMHSLPAESAYISDDETEADSVPLLTTSGAFPSAEEGPLSPVIEIVKEKICEEDLNLFPRDLPKPKRQSVQKSKVVQPIDAVASVLDRSHVKGASGDNMEVINSKNQVVMRLEVQKADNAGPSENLDESSNAYHQFPKASHDDSESQKLNNETDGLTDTPVAKAGNLNTSRRSTGPIDTDEVDETWDSDDEQTRNVLPKDSPKDSRSVVSASVKSDGKAKPSASRSWDSNDNERSSGWEADSKSGVTTSTISTKKVPKLRGSQRDTSPLSSRGSKKDDLATLSSYPGKVQGSRDSVPSQASSPVSSQGKSAFSPARIDADRTWLNAVGVDMGASTQEVNDEEHFVQGDTTLNLHVKADGQGGALRQVFYSDGFGTEPRAHSPPSMLAYRTDRENGSPRSPSVKSRLEQWESRASRSDSQVEEITSKGSHDQDAIIRSSVANAEWRSFLVKKVQAETAAATRTIGHSADKPNSTASIRDDDSLFNFDKNSLTDQQGKQHRLRQSFSKRSASPALSGNSRSVQASGMEEIVDLSPIPSRDDSDQDKNTSDAYGPEDVTMGSFFKRLAECTAPVMPASKNSQNSIGISNAHLAFMRANIPSNLCGRAENVGSRTFSDEEYEEKPQDVGKLRGHLSERSKSVSKEKGSSPDPRISASSGSVASDDFGAKTAYLEALAMKTAVSKPRSSSRRRDRSSSSVASSTVSSTSSAHSEKWKAFLEKKKASGAPINSRASEASEVSRAAERYAAEKVEEMMSIMSKNGDGRQIESLMDSSNEHSFRHSTAAPSKSANNDKRLDKGGYNESARAAEELAAARVEAMMAALSTSQLDEGEI